MCPGHINTRKVKNIYSSALWKLTFYLKRSRMKNRITSVQHGSAKCSDSPTCWFGKDSCTWGLSWVFREDWASAKWNGTGQEQSWAGLCKGDGGRRVSGATLWEPLKGLQQESGQWDRGLVTTWRPREGALSGSRHCNRKAFPATR